MNKSLLLGVFVLTLVLFSVSVFAEVKVLHTGWHEYNDVFTIDGKVIDIRLSENNPDLLRVRVDNISGYIELKKCKEFDIYTVCYINKSYDVSQTTITDNSGITMPGVQLNISYYDLSSDLSITPVLSDFNVFQERKVNVTLLNKKSQWIDLFTYEIQLPDSVSIVNKGDFTVSGPGKLTYTSSLSPAEQKIISFTILSSSVGSKKANYTISINSQGIAKDTKGILNFNVVAPYALTVSLVPSTVNVLDTSKLLINVRNTGSSDLELSNLTVNGSPELYYTAGRGLEVSDFGKYYVGDNEVISPGNDKEYYMIVTPSYLGKYDFLTTAYMKYNEKNIVANTSTTLTASAGGFMPVFYLSKDAVLSGSEVELYYSVSDTSSENIFNDINVAIASDFISENVSLARINTNEDKILLRKFITVPYVDKDTTYKINVTTNYLTQAGEKKQINSSKNLKVTANGTLLSLSQKLSAKEIYTGDELIVELSVKNMKDELFQINAVDLLPEGVEKIGGLNSGSLTVKGLGTESAYIYKLLVPLDSNITQINITSKVSIPAKGYSTTYSSIVKVKQNLTAVHSTGGNSGVITGSGSSSNASNNVTGIDVKKDSSSGEKDGPLRRFFRGINDFFVNLFSKK